jgi:hypothetical protein
MRKASLLLAANASQRDFLIQRCSGMLVEPIAPFLHPILDRLNTTLLETNTGEGSDCHNGEPAHLFGGGAPNHVLVNEYLPGDGWSCVLILVMCYHYGRVF